MALGNNGNKKAVPNWTSETETKSWVGARLFFAGEVSTSQTRTSFNICEIFGVPLYINGNAYSNMASEVFVPAWAAKTTEKEAEATATMETYEVNQGLNLLGKALQVTIRLPYGKSDSAGASLIRFEAPLTKHATFLRVHVLKRPGVS